MSAINRAEKFERDFELFKSQNADWGKYLTDSTYFELMDWYDATYHLGSNDENSGEAHDFANYVWERVHENEQRMEMRVQESRYDGSMYYELAYMTRDDLLSLHTMIKSACLPERQTFNRVKEQIEKILGL